MVFDFKALLYRNQTKIDFTHKSLQNVFCKKFRIILCIIVALEKILFVKAFTIFLVSDFLSSTQTELFIVYDNYKFQFKSYILPKYNRYNKFNTNTILNSSKFSNLLCIHYILKKLTKLIFKFDFFPLNASFSQPAS